MPKTFRRPFVVAQFVATQMLSQGLAFAAGILLVRYMASTEYGYYTLAIAMIGLAGVLLDLGLSTAVLAVAGRQPALLDKLGHILGDAFVIQKRLAAYMALPCGLFFILSFRKQGAEYIVILPLLALVAIQTSIATRNTLWLSIVRVRGDIKLQQRNEIITNSTRLLAVTAIAIVGLNANTALVVNTLAAILTLCLLRKLDAGKIALEIQHRNQYGKELINLVSKQAPNSLYYCFSGQISLWLVGWFGSTEKVAEMGALGRLGVLFAIVGSVFSALIQPYFAKSQSVANIVSGLVKVNIFFIGLTIGLMAVGRWYPQILLSLLGEKFSGLSDELLWLIFSTAMASWSGALYQIGAARGWIIPWLAVIPVCVGSIMITAANVDVSTVKGAFEVNCSAGVSAGLLALCFLTLKTFQMRSKVDIK